MPHHVCVSDWSELPWLTLCVLSLYAKKTGDVYIVSEETDSFDANGRTITAI